MWFFNDKVAQWTSIQTRARCSGRPKLWGTLFFKGVTVILEKANIRFEESKYLTDVFFKSWLSVVNTYLIGEQDAFWMFLIYVWQKIKIGSVPAGAQAQLWFWDLIFCVCTLLLRGEHTARWLQRYQERLGQIACLSYQLLLLATGSVPQSGSTKDNYISHDLKIQTPSTTLTCLKISA